MKTINEIIAGLKYHKDSHKEGCVQGGQACPYIGNGDRCFQFVMEDAIKMVEEEKLTFAFAHGDFTPWNVYYVKDEMRIFDMEYCSDTMPAYIDVFHYLSQTTLLANRYTAQCAMREYERQLDLISEYVDNPKLTFICYLVWIISFYLERTNDIEIIREKIDVWVEMLEYLVKYL